MSNIRHSTDSRSNVENPTSEEGRFGCRIFDIWVCGRSNRKNLITTLIDFVPCSAFFIFFPFLNLILPQKNNINAVICRQLNIKIFKKLLCNAIKDYFEGETPWVFLDLTDQVFPALKSAFIYASPQSCFCPFPCLVQHSIPLWSGEFSLRCEAFSTQGRQLVVPQTLG